MHLRLLCFFKQTITCIDGNSNKSFCGDYGDNLHMYFEKRGSQSTANAKFKFLLYVEKEDGKETWTPLNFPVVDST